MTASPDRSQPDCAAVCCYCDAYLSCAQCGMEQPATPAQPAGMREALEDLTGAMRFVLAFYEPGQRYLDTNAWKSAEAGARHAFKQAETVLAIPAERPAVAGFTEAEGHASSLRQQARWIEESPAAEMIDADELRSAANFIERMHGNAQASDTSLPESLVRSLRDHLQQSDSFLWLDEIQTLDAALASFEKIRGILARVCTCGVASYLSVHDAGCPLSSTEGK